MRLGTFFIFLFLTANCQAQVFQLNGSANNMGDDCYRLTVDQLWDVGSIWHLETIDLNEDFRITFELNLGCSDQNGADGIVFGFQNVSTSVGDQGGGIGFQGISPSIGIEFDTFQNIDFNDPVADHTALFTNGENNHAANVVGPITLSATSNNVEDCQLHDASIFWDATAKNLTMTFDCEERISENIDLVSDIFAGDPDVFWGFTSATGGLSNTHIVCLDFFTESLLDENICVGGSVDLNVGGGQSYEWSPATGLSATDIANPVASPLVTTTYSVDIIDACGNVQEDELTIFVSDAPVLDLGDTIEACEGETVMLDATLMNGIYDWSTGSDQAIIEVTETDVYEVTVDIGGCSLTESVEVIFEPIATATVDSSICNQSLSFQGVEIFANNSETFTFPNGDCDSLLTLNVFQMDCDPACETQVPTAFSPNNDGINDSISVLGDCELIFFAIVNRYGELIFESSPDNTTWDGFYNGEEQEIGLYAWYGETLDPATGIRTSIAGNITLIR